MAELTQHYVEQTSPLDVARAKDEFKLRLDALKVEMLGEPDVLKRESVFTQKARQAQQEILAKYPNQKTQTAAAVLMEDSLTGGIIDVRATAIQSGTIQNLEYRDRKRHELARVIGQSSDPVEQQKARAEYQAITAVLATAPPGMPPSINPAKVPEEMMKFDVQAVRENAVFRAGKGEGYKVLADVYSGKYDSLPFADREKIKNDVTGVLADFDRLDKVRKENEKVIHDQNLITDTIAAVSGTMTLPQLQEKAKTQRYTVEEFNTIRRAMEEGGVTDPNIAINMETQIRSNKLTDYNTVASNPSLDRATKSRLMGLITEQKDAKHFSKTPEYQEALKEIRAAISPKGVMESFDKVEQQRNLFSITEMWNRVSNGEKPMDVARDIQARIAREPTQGEKPLFFPRFKSEEDLVNAFKNKQVDRNTFDTESYLLKEWQRYNKQTAIEAAKPPPAGGSSNQRRRQ